MINICADTSIDKLASRLINDVLAYENFKNASSGKGTFLTGGSIIVCESKGLQEYIQKKCADMHGIWTALSFKPLAGLLMRCAFDLSPATKKKDEKENIFNQSNLVWAIYRLIEEDEKKKFYYANELASLFLAYQIYRPEMIKKWNDNIPYTFDKTDDKDDNLKNNEESQRVLWYAIREENKDEQDISQLYELIEKNDKKVFPKQIFIFAPLVLAPVQIKALAKLSESGYKINLYLYQISREYIGEAKSDKAISKLREKAWKNDKIADENNLYWDLGNRLIANLGRAAQVLYEQIGWDNFEYDFSQEENTKNTLLSIIQDDILQDNNKTKNINFDKNTDNSLTINSCFSVLRETEVLCDYLLDIFENNKDITPEDIAVVAPNMENYANAIESVFSRYDIPFQIADRDARRNDKTARLLNMLFNIQDNGYEAPDVCALFEYSLYAQGRELAVNDIERLQKWVKENAVRHGLENDNIPPDYSFKTGFDQLTAGFFMLPEDGFSQNSENQDYCYPDIEDSNLELISEFYYFIKALKIFEKEINKEKTISEWTEFFKENLKYFFGIDEVNFNEEDENPYQKVMGAWDKLINEIKIGFGNNSDLKLDFSIIKTALPNKLEENSKYLYTISGKVSFANIDTLRAVPHKVVCCIGMNGKEFPRQVRLKDISLMQDYILGDKDTVNEDRLMFLETILSAKEKLYISWIGQNEKTAEDQDPSSAVILLIKNLFDQYGINKDVIVKKYPLQPFSKKYLTKEYNTFDSRWNGEIDKNNELGIWHWRVNPKETEKSNNKDDLYRVLKDAPKYFLKDICNISLPEKNDALESIEPFIIESGLDKWSLEDLVINEESQEILENTIKISKRRGERPNGIYADRIIQEIKKDANELRKMAEDEKADNMPYSIYPSKDKGKYRLKHWIDHLFHNYNIKDNQNTKMFLKNEYGKNIKVELRGMDKESAKKILANLQSLRNELDTRLIPVFPDAAWIYLKKKDLEGAVESIFNYDPIYTKTAFGFIEEFNEKTEKEFIRYSNDLFNEYFQYIEGDK